MLKGVPSGETGVEKLQQEEAIWTLKCEFVRLNCRQNCSEATADLRV